MSSEEFHQELTTMCGSSLPFQINRSLLPIKAYYFVFMAAVGDLLPFIALYMRELGLNATETGVIYGTMAFIGFFMKPVIGAVADKFHQHKLVLIIITFCTGLMYMLLVTVPQRSPHLISVATTLGCNTQDSFLQDCSAVYSKDKCTIGLTHLSNMSTRSANNDTASTRCTVDCNEMEGEEFQACFTNDTGPFNSQHCNGILRIGRHLNFTVNDVQSVIDAEITQHTPANCKSFDLKDVYFENEVWQILCDREVNLNCHVMCDGVEKCKGHSDPFDKTFFLFFFLFLVANVALVPIFPILDAVTYDILGEKRHLWGKQRLWGTFGFALFAVTSTFVMYYWRENKEEVNYTYSFYIFGVLAFLSAFLANFIQFSSDIKCGEFIKNVWKLLSFKLLVFLFIVMYFGVVLGGQETFLFWYLTGLGSSPLVFGFMLVVNCVAEIPMLWIAGDIIQRIGMISCLYLALFCFGLRHLAYSFLQEPWLVLLVEPIHSVTFALMYAAASSYASIIAPQGMSATLQGLLGGVHFGFGKGIGSLLTGILFESVGPRWTWRFFSIMSIVILLVYFLLNTFVFTTPSKTPVVREPADTGHNDDGDGALPNQQLVPSTSGTETKSMTSPNQQLVPSTSGTETNFMTSPEDNHLTKV